MPRLLKIALEKHLSKFLECKFYLEIVCLFSWLMLLFINLNNHPCHRSFFLGLTPQPPRVFTMHYHYMQVVTWLTMHDHFMHAATCPFEVLNLEFFTSLDASLS